MSQVLQPKHNLSCRLGACCCAAPGYALLGAILRQLPTWAAACCGGERHLCCRTPPWRGPAGDKHHPQVTRSIDKHSVKSEIPVEGKHWPWAYSWHPWANAMHEAVLAALHSPALRLAAAC
jgi:hypothetical protein